MMKAYPEYKKSKVEWLSGVPSHWIDTTFKYCLEKIIDNRGRTPPVGDNGIPLVEAKQISKGGRFTTKDYDKFISDEAYEEYIRDDVLPNDILMVTVGSIGEICLVPNDCDFVIAQNIVGLRASTVIDSSYLYYYLKSDLASSARQFVNKESVLNSVKVSNFIQHKLSIPPLDEQMAIVELLDKETSKVEDLISEKESFIKLLQEKRQALISHVVTKGLDDNVKMKPSGVEWIGDIPDHWEMAKIKWVAKTESGGTPSTQEYEKYYENGIYPWIRTTDLNNSILSDTPIRITEDAIKDSACSLVKKDAVLVAMYGGAGTIGKHSLLGFDSTINQAVCAITTSRVLDPSFLHLFVEYYRPFWMLFADGTRKDPNINQDVVRNMEFPLPPLDEQKDIGVEFNQKQNKILMLMSETESSINLLKEHRTALISAAVTGKIDVREEV